MRLSEELDWIISGIGVRSHWIMRSFESVCFATAQLTNKQKEHISKLATASFWKCHDGRCSPKNPAQNEITLDLKQRCLAGIRYFFSGARYYLRLVSDPRSILKHLLAIKYGSWT